MNGSTLEISHSAGNVSLLAIDDEPSFLANISDGLAETGLEILTATDADEGLRLVERRHPRIVLLDLRIPGSHGMKLLERILEVDPGTEVIIVSGDYSTESAVEAIQKGASDYLRKPLSLESLRTRISVFVTEVKRRQRSLALEREMLETAPFQGIVSQSPLMWALFSNIRHIAPHYRTVLVTGATGTGKELVSRALWQLSPVSTGPFGVRNCSALVETLLESELFGHVKGAFTGATQDKVGLFEYADGGTVFLDEIGEMPFTMQAKLLRVLQNGEIQRVGSPKTRKVNVRVIAATHRNLKKMVEEKQFRQDLYYRLCVAELRLPTLAERKEDLRILTRHFLKRISEEYGKHISGITLRSQVLLSRHRWPGNVRELENVIGHACMMVHGNIIDVCDLPEYLRLSAANQEKERSQTRPSLFEVEQLYARRILEEVEGNKVRAAKILGVSRTTLYTLLKDKANLGNVDNLASLNHFLTTC